MDIKSILNLMLANKILYRYINAFLRNTIKPISIGTLVYTKEYKYDCKYQERLFKIINISKTKIDIKPLKIIKKEEIPDFEFTSNIPFRYYKYKLFFDFSSILNEKIHIYKNGIKNWNYTFKCKSHRYSFSLFYVWNNEELFEVNTVESNYY